MGVLSWVGKQPARLRRQGVRDTVSQGYREVSTHYARKLEPYDPRGVPIYERDWDALVVLDGCRVDALETVADEYAFLPAEIPSFRSLASTSKTWMDRNFTADYAAEMAKTAHVTGNPYSESHLDEREFLLLDEVWRYGWDDEAGTVPARPMTDRAVDAARRHDPDRLLVHYMQPHFPSVPAPIGSRMRIETFGTEWESAWDRLRDGGVDAATVWRSYVENLRYVLDDVELLLDSVDRDRVVITADHGNAFGEWGQYGHPEGVPLKPIRSVPWVVTDASDTGEYQPSMTHEETTVESTEVESRLEDLGYV